MAVNRDFLSSSLEVNGLNLSSVPSSSNQKRRRASRSIGHNHLSQMFGFFILCTVPGTKSRNKMGELAVSFLVYCTPVTGVAVHQRLTLFFTTLTHRIGALSSPPVSQRGKYCRRGWRLSRKYIAMTVWCFSIMLRRTTCGFRSKKSLMLWV